MDAAPARAIASPSVDALCVGGASLAVAAVLLVLSPQAAALVLVHRFAILNILLNWPHFMASYHLLYTTPGAVSKHPFAALYVPVFLLVYAGAAAALFGYEPLLFYVFHAAAAVYLAWHYTGQAWGMMAAFSRVEATPFDSSARFLVRSNLRVLLAWHAVWSLHTVAADLSFGLFAAVYQAMSAVAAASCALGIAGLWRLRRSVGRLPARVLLPWLAIHAWYLLLYRHPKALFWVQLSHATQYLLFPMRVEANREWERGGREPSLQGSAVYFALLTALGFAAFWLGPHLADRGAAWAASGLPAGVLVIDLLNIHHYFVDGCIWKLGNPEVRRELFLHLENLDERYVAKSKTQGLNSGS